MHLYLVSMIIIIITITIVIVILIFVSQPYRLSRCLDPKPFRREGSWC